MATFVRSCPFGGTGAFVSHRLYTLEHATHGSVTTSCRPCETLQARPRADVQKHWAGDCREDFDPILTPSYMSDSQPRNKSQLQ